VIDPTEAVGPMTGDDDPADHARFIATADAHLETGAVVVIDVLRAFTTAAYAFGAGARHIYLVGTVQEALALKASTPGALAMGEDRGRRVAGFDFANSPTEVARAELTGRIIVHRTSAGTQGVVAAIRAGRLWCAALANASATAAAVRTAGLGAPTYVITGWGGSPSGSGRRRPRDGGADRAGASRRALAGGRDGRPRRHVPGGRPHARHR